METHESASGEDKSSKVQIGRLFEFAGMISLIAVSVSSGCGIYLTYLSVDITFKPENIPRSDTQSFDTSKVIEFKVFVAVVM